jgi:hypothetical protein
MFYVKITKIGIYGGLNEKIIKLKTEKFYELIGRYMFKMGIPHEVTSTETPVKELCFYENESDNVSCVSIEYVKISNDGEIVNPVVTTNTIAPKLETTQDDTIVDERLLEMTKDGCFKVA